MVSGIDKSLCLVALALWAAACSTSVTTSGFGTVYEVTRVQELAVVRSLTASEAESFRDEGERIAEVALGDALFDAYWADELQTDYVILRPRGRDFELLKVKPIGTARVEKFEGERNGRPFSSITVY